MCTFFLEFFIDYSSGVVGGFVFVNSVIGIFSIRIGEVAF